MLSADYTLNHNVEPSNRPYTFKNVAPEPHHCENRRLFFQQSPEYEKLEQPILLTVYRLPRGLRALGLPLLAPAEFELCTDRGYLNRNQNASYNTVLKFVFRSTVHSCISLKCMLTPLLFLLLLFPVVVF